MLSTRELVANYSTYTDATELSHSAAADTTARTSPACLYGPLSSPINQPIHTVTFDHSC